MGQAKQRKAEIEQLKSKSKPAVILAPFFPDHSTNNMKAGDWMRSKGIAHQEAMVVGKMFHTATMCPIDICLLVTNTMDEETARGAIEGWWGFTKGPKFAAWIPLNNMLEMTVSGLEKAGQGVQGQTMAFAIEQAGFLDQFVEQIRKVYKSNPDFRNAFTNMGFGDMMGTAV